MYTTPSKLSVKPNVMAIIVPEYNFEEQSRDNLMAGKHTSFSVQTFGNDGKPKDAQNDTND